LISRETSAIISSALLPERRELSASSMLLAYETFAPRFSAMAVAEFIWLFAAPIISRRMA